ncbi:hypothetical protein PG990_013095 [Apiospora arundinis]
MEDLLRGPGPAFAFVPTIGLASVGCLAWLAYHPPLQSPRARWEHILLFLIGCVSVFAFLLVGCVLFVWARQGDSVWVGRLWKWDVLGIILIDSLYVIRAPLSEQFKKHVPASANLKKLTDKLWFALCFTLFVLLFLVLSFVAGDWTQLVAVCSHCVWTAVWCWSLGRGSFALAQLMGTILLRLEHNFWFLLLFFCSLVIIVAIEQWESAHDGSLQEVGTSYKVVMIGGRCVGKSIAIQHAKDPNFIAYNSSYSYSPTIESTHWVACNSDLLHVTDTGDCEEDNVSLSGFDGGIVVIDVRQRSSLTHIIKWAANRRLDSKPVLLLAMGKRTVSGSEVTKREVAKFARKQKWKYMEEKKDGKAPFDCLARMIRDSRRFEI